MPSAKQIKARKAFAKKYAKKGKRKAKSKKRKQTRKEIQKDTIKPDPHRKIYYDEKKGFQTELSDPDFDKNWDKKMQEFLNKSNNES